MRTTDPNTQWEERGANQEVQGHLLFQLTERFAYIHFIWPGKLSCDSLENRASSSVVPRGSDTKLSHPSPDDPFVLQYWGA